ncbi:ATP-dependent endonuclease [Vibrio sp. 1-Bac 57]
MYLESLEITNFRKFGTKNNKIEFVQSDYNKTIQDPSDKKSFVACATTLVIGKNNAGKTTVTKALHQIINSDEIKGTSFNLNYMNSLFSEYIGIYEHNTDIDEHIKLDKIDLPTMSFKLKVGLAGDPKSISVQNLRSIIPVEKFEVQKAVIIEVKFCIVESEQYKKFIHKLFVKALKRKKQVKFSEFLKVIDLSKFKRTIFDIKGKEVSSSIFNINNLLDLKVIKANLDDGDTTLSSVFNKIVQYKLRNEENDNRIKLEDKISEINDFMDTHVGSSHEESVNNVVRNIIDDKNMLVHLRSDLDFDSLFQKLISYEFQENNNYIPESQFGLGYSNLMKILGQIIDYIEQYEERITHDKVNLICIEEPENFMHPQMQELFIKNIDDALSALLTGEDKKNINSQLIITTHSPHIVNSKIHSSNTFNNINYITTDEDNFSNVVTLNDRKIKSSSTDSDLNALKFLKKHIKYKVSELFFSDAIILVEGITEEHLIQHHINESDQLFKFGISVFNIAGAYAHIYKPLIDILKIPCLIITDLDIKRANADKGKAKPATFKQISNLNADETTNVVLHNYICDSVTPCSNKSIDDDVKKSKLLPDKLEYFCENNFKVVFQKDPIEGYIASSFEEAYILTNYDNDILNCVLKELKPRIYKSIIGTGDQEDKKNSIAKSFEWQCKLASSKSEFANTLLYKIITSDSESPYLPKYIKDGLTWLTDKLNNSISKTTI